jgi:hypothetical protein
MQGTMVDDFPLSKIRMHRQMPQRHTHRFVSSPHGDGAGFAAALAGAACAAPLNRGGRGADDEGVEGQLGKQSAQHGVQDKQASHGGAYRPGGWGTPRKMSFSDAEPMPQTPLILDIPSSIHAGMRFASFHSPSILCENNLVNFSTSKFVCQARSGSWSGMPPLRMT